MKKASIFLSIFLFCCLSVSAQELEPPTNLNLYADEFIIYLSWEAPETTSQVLGYNIYRDGFNIVTTDSISYSDTVDNQCELTYYITAIYETGESNPSNSMDIYISICWFEYFSDDFDSYNPNEQLVCQNPYGWSTWSGTPCSDEDPYIVDVQSFGEGNAVIIEGSNDFLHPIPNYTVGYYTIRFLIYIPEGFDAYFNTLQEYEPSNFWGMQVYFDSGENATLDAGSSSVANFPYPNETWILNEIWIDLDNDWATYYFNDELIYEWTWSLGTFGGNFLNQLGGSNFYAYVGSGGQSKFYIDEYMLGTPSLCIPGYPTNILHSTNQNNISFEWTNPGGNCEFLGSNIYRNNELINFTTENFFTDENLAAGSYYYTISSVYDNIEIWSEDTIFFEIDETILFFDNFDSYTPGQTLFSQNPEEWTIISGAPGPCSAIITDTLSYSNPCSVSFIYHCNIIKTMESYDTGVYSISFNLYIPENREAYFSVFQIFDPVWGSYQGLDVYFTSEGQGYLYAGSNIPFSFEFVPDNWFSPEIIIDLNNNWASFYQNDSLIHSWLWSSGSYGTGGINKLNGVDFGNYISGSYNVANFFLDDFKLVLLDSLAFFDGFENYTAGEQVVCQNPDNWTTWNSQPCSVEDPVIVDTFYFEGLQSVLIQDSNNLVKSVNNYTSGIFEISFQMYIPTGENGFFGLLQEFDGDNTKVGCQMNFDSDGYIYFENGSLCEPGFYNSGSWLKNEIIIDLDEDWAKYYLDDVLMVSWPWSLGVNGTNNLNQFGGVNFRAYSEIINEAKYFIDNLSINELDSLPCNDPPQNLNYTAIEDEIVLSWEAPDCPDILGYNIYFDMALLDFTTDTFYSWQAIPGNYFEFCIISLYSDDASDCAWITIVIPEVANTQNQPISVYPNPTNDLLLVNSENNIERYRIYNLSGLLLIEKLQNQNKECQINLTALDPGTYILKIETKEKAIYKKIIKR